MRIITPVFIIMGVVLVTHAAFNGAGSTHLPTLINIISFIFVQLSLALILPVYTPLGAAGIPAAICISFIVQGLLTLPVYKKGLWIRHKI